MEQTLRGGSICEGMLCASGRQGRWMVRLQTSGVRTQAPTMAAYMPSSTPLEWRTTWHIDSVFIRRISSALAPKTSIFIPSSKCLFISRPIYQPAVCFPISWKND